MNDDNADFITATPALARLGLCIAAWVLLIGLMLVLYVIFEPVFA